MDVVTRYNKSVACLRSTTLFAAPGLLLRRVTCDGVDERRLAEEHSSAACIVLVLRGRFSFRDRTTRAVPSPSVGLFLQNDHPYEIRHVNGEGDVCLALQGELTDALVARGRIARDVPHAAYLSIQSAAARLAAGQPAPRLALEDLLCEALDATGASEEAPRGRNAAIADTIARAIGRGFHATLPLAALAGAAGVSVFHACHAFRRATGMSIRHYHREVRLRHGLAMLVETEVPLAQLALDLGFNSQPHFTNLFRRRFGVTPHALRRGRRAEIVRLAHSDLLTRPAAT